MIVIDSVGQGSEEWLNMRLGKITASRVEDIMSNGRGGKPSAKSESYMVELIAEILSGQSKPFFTNDAMRWGTETEPQARAMYELETGNEVKEVAFIELNEFVGMSPDGLVGDEGLLEIKCPATHTQIKRALSDSYHSDYKAQIQMQLWVSGRKWCDFVSFDPRLDCKAGFLLERVERDEEYISEMEARIETFIDTMKKKIEILTNE